MFRESCSLLLIIEYYLSKISNFKVWVINSWMHEFGRSVLKTAHK